MRYYISDCHFFHENLLRKMDQRPFESVEAMNEHMIEKWNGKVRKNDDIVILGDLSFGYGEQTNSLLDRLNGRKFLITGNHDRRYLDDKAFDPGKFVWIKDYAVLRDSGKTVVLCHYPIMCYDGQYRKDENGEPRRYMLYGHVHNTMDETLVNSFIRITRQSYHVSPAGEKEYIPCNMINCFCMFSGYEPLSLAEWIETDRKRREGMEQ